jgi:hypothetical protein
MERIQNVQPLVFNALVSNPATRTDDFILVLEVYKNFISKDMKMETVFLHHKELGIPSFASVVRTRRKLQKKHPELKNASTAAMREKAETEYRAYALNC